jgi:large subunit ribosomal protein L25
MPEIALAVDARPDTGSAASRRLRAEGRIPAVVYGHGIEPLSVAVDARALRGALTSDAGTNALLRLELGETEHLVLARDIQRHPVRHTVSHVDFQIVRRDEIVHAEVNVTLTGDAVAVHKGEGTVAQEIFSLEVKAKPADLPSHLELDISELQIGDQLRVSDIVFPEGVATDLDPETILVIAHPPRVVVEEVEEAEEEEGAVAAAAAEGAAEGGGAGEVPASAESSSEPSSS